MKLLKPKGTVQFHCIELKPVTIDVSNEHEFNERAEEYGQIGRIFIHQCLGQADEQHRLAQ